jgi:hypothetical protein
MANKKTTEHAAEVIRGIKAEYGEDIIKNHHMPSLCDINTGKTTGFAVVMELKSKSAYTDALLNDWKQKFAADTYQISVSHNRLEVTYKVRFDEKKKQPKKQPKEQHHTEESSVYDGPEGVWDNR